MGGMSRQHPNSTWSHMPSCFSLRIRRKGVVVNKGAMLSDTCISVCTESVKVRFESWILCFRFLPTTSRSKQACSCCMPGLYGLIDDEDSRRETTEDRSLS